jgi:uncharacterized protein HemY
MLESVKIDSEAHRPEGVALGFGNIGILFSRRREWRKAEHFFRLAVNIARVHGLWLHLAEHGENLGRVLLAQDRRAEAVEILGHTARQFDEMHMEDRRSKVEALIAEAIVQPDTP